MGGGIARDDLHREIAQLRDRCDALAHENECLRKLFMPPTHFPSAWKLTATEGDALAALYACKSYLTKAALHHAMSGDEAETDEKMVDIYVHKLRRKLQPFFGDTIETLWARGYGLTRNARAAIAAAIAGADHTAASEGAMAFETIIVGLKKPKPQGSIVLSDKAGTGRPRCRISLTKAFAETFGLAAGQRLEVQLGTGTDEGKLRFLRTGAKDRGIAVTKVGIGGVSLTLGHVPALGEEALAKTALDVALVDDTAFDVVLPGAAGEALVRVHGVHMTDLTLVLGKSRIAKLQAAADEAGEPIEKYAARLFANVIDEDDDANRKAA
jgi:two-component system cell cycle response regulator CtrA